MLSDEQKFKLASAWYYDAEDWEIKKAIAVIEEAESAATAPLLARIAELVNTIEKGKDLMGGMALKVAELERELAEARKDEELLDWLDNNIFAREPDEWDQRYGVCRDGKTQMWAIFAPKGVHGSARKIIDAAIKEQT